MQSCELLSAVVCGDVFMDYIGYTAVDQEKDIVDIHNQEDTLDKCGLVDSKGKR